MAAKAFAGTWLDDENGLLLDVTVNADGTLSAAYDGGTAVLSVGTDGVCARPRHGAQPSGRWPEDRPPG